MTPNETEAWLRMAFAGLPAGRCRSALVHWNGPEALLQAARDGHSGLATTPGLTDRAIERLREAATRDLARQWEAMATHAIRIVSLESPDYPAPLKAIPDPPPYLFVRGTIVAEDEVAIAIVGTRKITEYGKGVAHKLAADFGQRGVTVVSGLARGIDTAAHRGALDAGGRTIAVTACGLDIVYPSDNRELMAQIEASGTVVSEWPPTVHPESWHFPARNRIISGLAAGVVVVEAAEKSGALITADFALEQGREVFAVPGNIHKVQSRGPHNLIKLGASLVESADDIMSVLNMRSLPFEPSLPLELPEEKVAGTKKAPIRAGKSLPGKPEPGLDGPRPDFSPAENRIWLVLDVEPRHIDDIAAEAGFSAAETNAALVMLELKGSSRRLPGNLFARTVK